MAVVIRRIGDAPANWLDARCDGSPNGLGRDHAWAKTFWPLAHERLAKGGDSMGIITTQLEALARGFDLVDVEQGSNVFWEWRRAEHPVSPLFSNEREAANWMERELRNEPHPDLGELPRRTLLPSPRERMGQ